MAEKTKVFVIIRDNFLSSVGSDAVTFGILIGGVWFNQNFCGGSYFLNAMLLLMLIAWFIAKAASYKKFKSAKEAIAFLQSDGERAP